MKSKMKKVSAIAIVFLLSVFAAIFVSSNGLSVYAAEADTPVLSFTTGDVRQGDEFTGTLFFEKKSNVSRMAITLKYDTNIVDFIDCEVNEDSLVDTVINTTNNGEIKLSFVSTRNINAELPLVDIKFRVLDDLNAGSYDFLTLSESGNSVSRLNSNNIVENIEFESDFESVNIYRQGDINMDGIVDGIDAVYILRYEAGLNSGNETQSFYLPFFADYSNYSDHQKFILEIADAHYDGMVNGGDAVSILRHEVGFNETLGNRINIDFYDYQSNLLVTRSIEIGSNVTHIPNVPEINGYTNGRWSLSTEEYIEPNYTSLSNNTSVFAFYDEVEEIPDDVTIYNGVIDALATVFPSDNSYITSGFKLPYKNNNVAYNIPTKGNFDPVEITWYLETSSTGEGLTDYVSTIDYTCIFKNNDGSFVFDYTTWVTFTAHIWINGVQYEDCVYSRKVLGTIDIPDSSRFANIISDTATALAVANEGQSLPGYISLESDRQTAKINGVQYVDINWVVVDGDARGFNSKTNSFISLAQDNVLTLRYSFVFDNHIVYGGNNSSTITVTVPAKSHDDQLVYAKNYLKQYVPPVLSGIYLFPTSIDLYDMSISWASGSASGKIDTNLARYTYLDKIYQQIGVGDQAGYMETGYLIATITQNGEQFTAPISFDTLLAGESTEISLANGKIHDANLYNALLEIFGVDNGMGGRRLTEESLQDVEKIKRNNYSLDLSNKGIRDLTGIEYVIGVRSLNLSGNDFSGTDANLNKLNALTYLVQLNLSHCNISQISDNMLSKMYLIEGLDLSYNNLTNLDFMNYAGNPREIGTLKDLFVHENPITDISGLQFINGSGETKSCIPNVKRLTLNRSGDSDTSLDISPLQYITNVTMLWLKNHNITDISVLSNCKSLTELDLSENCIEATTKVFGLLPIRNIPSLTVLLLDNNEITSIQHLSKLINLQVLSLSGNTISSTGSYLDRLVELEYLDLDNNCLMSFNVSSLTNLKYLYLENNGLEILSGLVNNGGNTNITNIVELRLNGNDIGRDYIENIAELTTLRYLSLSGNNVGNLEFVSGLTSLKHLELANANVDQIYYKEEEGYYEENGEMVQGTVQVDYDNLSYLYDLTELIELDLSDNSKLYSIDGITNSQGTQTGGLSSASGGLRNVQILYLDNITLEKANSVSNMLSMRILSMQNSGVKDASFVRSLSSLAFLNLSGHCASYIDFSRTFYSNSIDQMYLDSAAETTIVVGLSKLESMVDLTCLSLRNLDISSMDEIPEMENLLYLNLAGTKISDFYGTEEDGYYEHSIANFHSLQVLDVSDNDSVFTKSNLNLLYDTFNNITVYLYNDHSIVGFNSEREAETIQNFFVEIPNEEHQIHEFYESSIQLQNNARGYDLIWSANNEWLKVNSGNTLSVYNWELYEDAQVLLYTNFDVYENDGQNNQVSMSFTVKPSPYSIKLYDKTLTDSLFDDSSFEEYIGYFNVPISCFESKTTDGYTFGGWYTEKYGEGSHLVNGYRHVAKTENGVENVLAYAKWTYIVQYNGKGGEFAFTKKTYTSNETIVHPALNAKPSEGVTFDGWYTSNSVRVLEGETTGNISLNATWVSNKYAITLVTNGGAIREKYINSDYGFVYTYGEPCKLPEYVTKQGYTFDGWYNTDGERITKTNKDQYGDVTYYAHWTLITYSIVFDFDDDEITGISGGEGYSIENPYLFNSERSYPSSFRGWVDNWGVSYAPSTSSVSWNEKWNGNVWDGDTITLTAKYNEQGYSSIITDENNTYFKEYGFVSSNASTQGFTYLTKSDTLYLYVKLDKAYSQYKSINAQNIVSGYSYSSPTSVNNNMLWFTVPASKANGRWRLTLSDNTMSTCVEFDFDLVDIAAPVVSNTVAVVTARNEKVTANNVSWTNEGLDIIITASDTFGGGYGSVYHSGIESAIMYYTVNGVEYSLELNIEELSQSGYRINYKLTNINPIMFDFCAMSQMNIVLKDKAGNSTTKQYINNYSTSGITINGRLDTIAPAVPSITADSGTGAYTNRDITLNIQCIDYANRATGYYGISNNQYSYNNGSGIKGLYFFMDEACTVPLNVIYNNTTTNYVTVSSSFGDTLQHKVQVKINYDTWNSSFGGKVYVVAVDYVGNRSDGKEIPTTVHSEMTMQRFPGLNDNYTNANYWINPGVNASMNLKRDTYVPQVLVKDTAGNVLANTSGVAGTSLNYTFPWQATSSQKIAVTVYHGGSGGVLYVKNGNGIVCSYTIRPATSLNGYSDINLTGTLTANNYFASKSSTNSTSYSSYASFSDTITFNAEGATTYIVYFRNGAGVQSSNISITTRIDKTAPTVQLLGFSSNLRTASDIHNAYDFIENDLISFSSNRWFYPQNDNGYYAVFKVSDTGSGICTTNSTISYGVNGTSLTQSMGNRSYTTINGSSVSSAGGRFRFEFLYDDGQGNRYSYSTIGYPMFIGSDYYVQVPFFDRTTLRTLTTDSGKTLYDSSTQSWNVIEGTYLRYKVGVADFVGNVGYATVSDGRGIPMSDKINETGWGRSVLRYYVDPFTPTIQGCAFYTLKDNVGEWNDSWIEGNIGDIAVPYTMTPQADTGWTNNSVIIEINVSAGLSGYQVDYRYQDMTDNYDDNLTAQNLKRYPQLEPDSGNTLGVRILYHNNKAWIVFNGGETRNIQIALGVYENTYYYENGIYYSPTTVQESYILNSQNLYFIIKQAG